MKKELLDEFIEMRISGKTFAEIAEALDVSKQTLINWSKIEEVKGTVSFGKLAKLQSTLKAFELDREARVQRLAVLAQKINAELEKRDFSEMPTDQLLKMAVVNEKRLEEAVPVFTFQPDPGLLDWIDKSTFTFNPVD